MANVESSPGGFARLVSGKRSKWAVLVVWIAMFLMMGSLAGKLNDVQKNDSSSWLPKSAESTSAINLETRFHPSYIPALVVFARAGGLTDADKSAIGGVTTTLKSSTDKAYGQVVKRSVLQIDVPAGQPHSGEASEILVPLDPGTAGWNTLPDDVKAIKTVASAVPAGVQVYITGPAGIAGAESDAFKGINGILTYFTFGVVILILLVAYRSPLLWLLPILTVMFALLSSEGIVYLLAKHAGLTVNGQSAFILIVLVLGAGTDYALLLIARYREELRKYADRHEAMAHALHRAGPALVASSATVAISMLVLLLAEMNSTKGLGPVLAIGVVVALAAMLTLMPALLVIFGRWMFWPVKPEAGSLEPTARGVWARIGLRIARKPRIVWIGTALVLGVLAVGVTQANVHPLTSAEQFTTKPDAITGLELQAKYFPPASGQPIVVIGAAGSRDAITKAMAVRGIDASSIGTPPGTQQTVGDLTYVEGTMTDAADSAAGRATVDRVRTSVHAADSTAKVGGMAAATLDSNRANSHDMKLIIPVILLVVFIILALLLRALMAPILLIGTVILSFGCSMGISSLAFKAFGWGGMDTSLPLFVFVFLVALGIDYNIFLMTRIREESLRRGTRMGALVGLSATGGVITWAGLVLAGTFGVLATLPIVPFAEIGFAVSLGVLLDTMIVRSVLVTALTLDIGKKMWLPSRLSKSDEPDGGRIPSALVFDDEAAVLVQ